MSDSITQIQKEVLSAVHLGTDFVCGIPVTRWTGETGIDLCDVNVDNTDLLDTLLEAADKGHFPPGWLIHFGERLGWFVYDNCFFNFTPWPEIIDYIPGSKSKNFVQFGFKPGLTLEQGLRESQVSGRDPVPSQVDSSDDPESEDVPF